MITLDKLSIRSFNLFLSLLIWDFKLLLQSVWNGSTLTANHAKLAIISEK